LTHIIFSHTIIYVPLIADATQMAFIFSPTSALILSCEFIWSQDFYPFPLIISLLAGLFLHEAFFQ
jgi:hypothetical protein